MDVDFAYTPGEGLPASAFSALRQAGPVVWSERDQGWLISSFEAVRTALSDVSRFTQQGTPVAEVFGGEGMLVNDTPVHHTIRAVWAKSASAAVLEAQSTEFVELARRVFDEPFDRLASGESVDFIPLFRQLVTDFIAVSFEVPPDRVNVFRVWSDLSAVTPALGVEEGSEDQRRHEAARAAILELLEEMISERKRRLALGDAPSDYTGLMVAAEGREGITPSVVTDNLFNFILGAFDTTERWLGNILVRLCREPAERERLGGDRSLITSYNEEVMRFDTVAQVLQRRVRYDGVELGGKIMQAGDAVFLLLGAANREPTAFEQPDTFDMQRSGQAHLGFGFGFHHCLGINIARQEARAFVDVLLDHSGTLDISECDYGSTWALWGPRRLVISQP